MNNLKQYLLDNVASPDFKVSKAKLEQGVRNRIKDDLTNLFYEYLVEMLEDEEQTILVERIKGAVGIGVNNESAGLIPIQLSLTLKNLDEDILELGEEYRQAVEEKEAKAKAKAEKVAKAKVKIVDEGMQEIYDHKTVVTDYVKDMEF